MSREMSREMSSQVVIVGAARTPLGSFQGSLSAVPAVQLGATAIRGALEQAGVDPTTVDEVVMGMVLPAGVGQAPARQASKAAGIPDSAGCLTINKVCGSGLKAIMLGVQAIRCGDAKTVVSGGMENMSSVPYVLPKARDGYRLGHGQLLDSMVHDGLWSPYDDSHMGMAAELCADECSISREEQDAYAALSYTRALKSIEEGLFADEICSVEVKQRRKVTTVDQDEEPFRGNVEKLPSLRPAFKKEGSVTAGNASTINDGACATVLMSAESAKEQGLSPLARIVGYSTHAQAPEWFTTAPTGAVEALLAKTGHTIDDIDIWEINEAFAVVSLVNQRKLGISDDKINVKGGAVALGHPIGCSGARILTTLAHTMKQRSLKRGVAAICIGGGEAVAVMLERD